MPTLPHDVTDLRLAPLLLALEERLEEMGRFTSDELRAAALLIAVERFIECHGWALAWHPRGLQVLHDDHRVVLGIPAIFGEYLLGISSGRDLDQARSS